MSSGLLGMIGIGLSGLNAAQAGLNTTQQNISNANTAGYNRQETLYAAQTPSYSSSGWIGNGVTVASVQRVYSQFLDSQVQSNQSQLSYYQTYSTQASQVDSLLGSTTNGLSNQIDSFFSAANEVANNPTSTAARQTLLAGGQTLSSQINNLYSSLQQQITSSNQAVSSLTTQINTYAQQIASLNQSITSMQAQNGQPPNDMLDQRDQAVASLNSLANVTTMQQSNGQINVYIGNGQALVSGNQANQLTTTTDPTDTSNSNPPSLVPQLIASGTKITLDSSQITGGQLGGWLASTDAVVKPAMANLNRIAVSIGAAVNQVQTSGTYYDTTSNSMQAGSNFFSSVVSPTGGTTDAIGISLTSNPLVNSNFTVTYDAGSNQYTVTSAAGSDTASAGTEFTINGVAQGFSINPGTPAPSSSGDTWSLNFQNYAATMSTQLSSSDQIAAAASTATGPGDNSNALALAALQTTKPLDNGNTTFDGAASNMVGSVATAAANADLNSTTFSTMTTQATQAQQSFSGVNLDEEAANLIRYQQTYQAAARVLAVVNTLFTSILAISP